MVRGTISFNDTVVSVLFQTGDEVNVSLTKRCIPLEVGEPSIKPHDIPFVQGNVWGDGLFVRSTGGDYGKAGKIARVVELDMKFYRSFCFTKRRPVEQREAQINDSRIDAVERVLEAELMRRSQRLTFGQHPFEEFFKKLMRSMRIGIGEG